MSSTRPVLSSTGSFAVFSWPAHAAAQPAAGFQSSAARGLFRLDAQQEAAAGPDGPAAAKGLAPAAASPAPAAAGAVADAEPAIDVNAMQAAATKQASLVRQLKKDGAPAAEIEAAVAELKKLRADLEAAVAATASNEPEFNRKEFDKLLLAKMFVVPSFEIHGGVAGLFDLGPPSCALKANVLEIWRRHFVLEENMLEMECTNLTPYKVLKTSGHVDKFTDLMVRDVHTGECFRADKLLEDFIDKFLEDPKNKHLTQAEVEEHRRVQRQADAYSPEELSNLFRSYGIKSPTTGNDLSTPFPFNLMFQTHIGPEGTSVGYLRPETAQGLFVNFRRLLDYNQQRLPFAAAQIGIGFRNEISPRGGLLRVREFCMAEIEHFVNPHDKSHPSFHTVADKTMVLFGRDDQLGSGRTRTMTIGEAVAEGLVANQTLGYFMARTQLFLEKIGIDPARLRFRQHLKTEMAHYATDCWDAEIKTSYGWVECVGHADRACYDLLVHTEATGVAMLASERLPEPVTVESVEVVPDKKLIGPKFKKDQKAVLAALERLADDDEARDAFRRELEANGSAQLDGFTIEANMVSFQPFRKTVVERKYTPSVIEPSFGIGRILYAVMEHAYSQREEDEQRNVMSFKPCVAPIKVGIFPLTNNAQFDSVISRLNRALLDEGIATKIDATSGSVGRRYARADELGTPFGITVDFETLTHNSVTLRERDSTSQLRIPIDRVVETVQALVRERVTWEELCRRYPLVTRGPSDLPVEKTPRAFFTRPNISSA